MLVIYDKTTHEIVGHCATIFDNGKDREATIEELLPDRDRASLEALYLKDDPRFMVTGAQSYRIAKNDQGVVTGIEHTPRIFLKTDASDEDGDGVPDLPADGQASTAVTANLSGAKNVSVTFRTTRGSLERRTVASDENGYATVRLRAAGETVAAHITATAPGFLDAALAIEFRPLG